MPSEAHLPSPTKTTPIALLAIFLYPLDFLIDTPILAGIIYFMESSGSILEASGEGKKIGISSSREERNVLREKKKRAIREFRSLERLILEEGFLEHLEKRLSDASQRSHTTDLSQGEILQMVATKAVALIEVLGDPSNKIAVRYVQLKMRIENAFAARTKLKSVPEKPLNLTQKIKTLASTVMAHRGAVIPKAIRHFPPSREQSGH